jgi:thiol:disulfide interchange protein DsbD|tara:strand:- start:3839 stop:4273 length:435 start_codon:yes stop_codon:yes gene_type:complete
MRSIFLFFAFFIYLISFSQNPVNWNISYNKNTVVFSAEIDSNWHLYAVDVPFPNQGPLPTIVEFKKQKNYLLKGKVYQEKPIIKYDKDFGIDVAYYQNKTNFYQKIRPISDSFKIQGNINYMACDDNQCLALEKIFNLQVNRQD